MFELAKFNVEITIFKNGTARGQNR